MTKTKTITQDLLLELFKYDSESGILTNKITRGSRATTGSIAGCMRPDGYLAVCINRTHYLVHRVVYCLHHGHFPEFQIDHINGIKSDNRICNLRDVTLRENQLNAAIRADNTTGITGIYRKESGYVVRMSIYGKMTHISSHADIESAIESRKAMEVKLGFHENHGLTRKERATH